MFIKKQNSLYFATNFFLCPLKTSEKKQTSGMKGVKYLQWTSTVSNTTTKLQGRRPCFFPQAYWFCSIVPVQLTDCVDFENRFAHKRKD